MLAQQKQQLVKNLQLLPHPEGGFYKESYRSVLEYDSELGKRNLCTGIYFLLEKNNFSAFHKIKSEELWHFYTGANVEIILLYENGTLHIKKLGNPIADATNPNDVHFQVLVPPNVWFGSRLVANAPAEAYSLVGCTVSFGFDFADFELAKREDLLAQFPHQKNIILEMTR